MKVMVTGANGFVGKALCQQLVKGHDDIVIAAVRSSNQAPEGTIPFICGDINNFTKWDRGLTGIDTVIHLAGRAHVMKESSSDPLSLYREVNTQGTIALAKQAAASSVRRLIYISTIKVCGEGQRSIHDRPFNEAHNPDIQDPYALSKWEAEQALIDIAESSQMEIVIIRPPLIYGPGVKANFFQLMDAINKGLPMPVAGIRNRRDMVYVGNLVDAIINCIDNPEAANKTFVLADDKGASTPQLVKHIAQAFDKPVRLIWVPISLLSLAGTITGKKKVIDRLCDSLIIDDQKIRQELGWKPPYSIQHGIKETVKWFIRYRHTNN